MTYLLIPLTLFGSPALAQDAEPEPEAETEAEAEAEEVGPITYTLTPEVMDLWVLIRYDRDAAMARLGHDHVITPTTFEGTVTWDRSDVSNCAIDISFPVSALTVDPGDARSQAGLDGETPDGDKKKIKDNFLGNSQLYADQFPTINFQSTSCSGSPTEADVTGELTIRGQAEKVTATMSVTADESSFSANGTFNAQHSDFGFEPFSALLGALRNDNDLRFHVRVDGKAK